MTAGLANRAGDPYDRPPYITPDNGQRDALRRAALALADARAGIQRWHNAHVGLLASALGPGSLEYTDALEVLQDETSRRSAAARDVFMAAVVKVVAGDD